MRIQLVMTLPREAASVPLVRRTVSVALSSAGVDPEFVTEAEVALSEACTNVYHHAGEGEDYEVLISIGDEQLTMDVLDSWTGFGHRPTWPAVAMPDASAESGRGLAIMAALTDQAVFDSVTGEGGSVHLIKRLRWAPNAPLLPPAPHNATDGAAHLH